MVAAFESTRVLNPPLKWAGGKRWLVPYLLPYWQRRRNYRLVEPFVGGLAVTLGLAPSRALLNDVNPHLISFYRWLQRGLVVDEQLSLTFANERLAYVRNRSRFNNLIAEEQHESAEAAALFYYLNRTGFNGLCRFNSSGFFNVPFGRHKKINYREEFSDFQERFKDWAFSCGDFESLKVDASDFIYADPPYDVQFTKYSAGGFDWAAQVRLAHWLSHHPGPVVASNQATPRILDLYESLGFKIETVPAPRRISCDGNRDDALEMVATKGV